MPTYQYKCTTCGLVFEELGNISNNSVECIECGEKALKTDKLYPGNFHIKDGWQKTLDNSKDD